MKTTFALETKPDFAKTLARFEAWWHCEVIDRAVVQLQVKPTRPYTGPTKQHASLKERWMDVEYHAQRALAEAHRHEYLADSFAMWMPNLGPKGLMLSVGGEFADAASAQAFLQEVGKVTHAE